MMKLVSSIKTVRKLLKEARLAGSIGFVPTMGAFHEGHLSLMRKARRECEFTVVSLFVNPLQFGHQEDYGIYPRELASDRRKAAQEGIDLLWTPSQKGLFPSTFQTNIEVTELSRRWEGHVRPGHFKGVATIVGKLLQIVQPEGLYLGQKDYQQSRVIIQMIKDLHFDTKVRVLPTVREPDGLAMSSRNKRLSAADRKLAPLLYRALKHAKKNARKGERNAALITQAAESILRSEPGIKIDYLALCDPIGLEPIERLERQALLLAAIRIGRLRLIDNILLKRH